MSEREIRCAVEWRQDETRESPGRLCGELITYGQRASDRAEVFAAGALTWPDDGVVLNLSHDRKQPLIRFVPELVENRVVVDVALPDTSRGRDAAVLVKNGTMRGLSVEFRALDEGKRGAVREIRAARLLGAALVDDASYKGALEVRQRDRGRRRRVWL